MNQWKCLEFIDLFFAVECRSVYYTMLYLGDDNNNYIYRVGMHQLIHGSGKIVKMSNIFTQYIG